MRQGGNCGIRSMKMKSKVRLGFMVLTIAAALMGPYLRSRYLNSGNNQTYVPINVISTDETRQTYYKWQDDNGQWHFGDEPPEGVTLHEVNIDTAANILQPVAVAKKDVEKPESKAAVPQKTLPLPMTVDPESVKDMMDKAENVQNLMNERNQQLKEIP